MTYGTSGAPRAPRVNTGGQTARNTSGYRDPFPSLSSTPFSVPPAAPAPRVQSSSALYGQAAPKPPQQVVAPAAAAQAQPTPQAPRLTYSYDADPVLNQIQALSTQDRASAEANALALRQQTAQQFGDVGLAQQYGGDAAAQAAANNPTSVLAQLAHSYQLGQQDLENQLNQANLFYSGARVKQLGDFANQYQAQQAQAAQQEQQQLGGITSNLAAALHAADLQDQQAQQDAANRALQAALASAAATPAFAPTPDVNPTDLGPPAAPIAPAGPTASGLDDTLNTIASVASQAVAPNILAALLAAPPPAPPPAGYGGYRTSGQVARNSY